jgi:hypothetical protein
MKTNNSKNHYFHYSNLIISLFLSVIIVMYSGQVRSESGDALYIDEKGNVGIGTNQPGAQLDVKGNIKTGEVMADKLFTGDMEVTNVLRARTVLTSNPMRHRMYPAGPVVYQDIFEAKNKGVIVKLGAPSYNETSYTPTNPWYDRPLIRFGGNNEADGNGAKVTIPKGYDTVWVRVLGERWNVIHAYFLDGDKEDLGLWTGGWRSSNSYSPDGTLADGHQINHQWVPIPAGRAGELALVSKLNTDKEFWVSGLAFSKNPWAHAVQSAVGYFWKVNGGDATEWGKDWHNWHGDSLSRINQKTQLKLKVPVVPSGRDKLLYLVEHNNDWNGAMHTGITVNGESIERFMATYDNPFARHWNSKIYNRYIAAHIQASIIKPGDRFLTVVIDMTKQDNGIHFREIGTHDMDMPWE